MLTVYRQGIEPAANASRKTRFLIPFACTGNSTRLSTPYSLLRAHAAGVGAYALAHWSHVHAAHVIRNSGSFRALRPIRRTSLASS